MNNHLVIREYGCIVLGKETLSITKDRIQVQHSAYGYLKSLLDDPQQTQPYSQIFNLTVRKGVEMLCVQNYVGVLQTPCGLQIEILPKVYHANDHADSDEHARKILVKMLATLQSAPFKIVHETNIMSSNLPLLEVFFGYFLSLVNYLIKKGIVRDYVSYENNQPFLKGKLLTTMQLKKNLMHKERFYVSHDEYEANRPENRLIKSSLLLVSKLSKSMKNQKLSNELLFLFDEIPPSKDYKTDFSRCKTDRSLVHYQDVLAWCKILLENQNPVPSVGSLPSLSILFPMERIFEDYVAAILKRNYPQWKVKTQVATNYLVSNHNDRKIFRLRPDLMIDNGEQVWVADTKWKLIDQTNRDKKYNISESDMYQLFAYGHKYLTNDTERKVILIYPKTDTFTKPLHPFIFETDYRLEVIPFDLDLDRLVSI
jgi:5-methylcytosine-specific restriction enzyme subunit McrC